MSWHGLTGFAGTVLHLTGPARYAVPVSLDGAGMACAALALRATIARDSAAGPRALLWVFVAASATANGYAADTTTGLPAALFFSGMSLMSVALFDLVLRQLRRSALRQVAALEAPLPRFRALRWARFTQETWAAWSLALRYGLSCPAEALKAHWQTTGTLPSTQPNSDQSTDVHPTPGVEVSDLSQAAALRLAFQAIESTNVPDALAWLAQRGIPDISPRYAYAVAKRVRETPRPTLKSLPSGGAR